MAANPDVIDSNKDFFVIINNEKVELKGKESYLFVDVFDVYPFDRTRPRGTLVTTINGSTNSYLETIECGDELELYWKDNQ
jgi:hypothetical protein